jgi:hypothetical protein
MSSVRIDYSEGHRAMRYLALISIILSSASGQTPNVVYDSATTAGRPLTNSESAELRSLLKWSPPLAQVKLGGSTRTQLEDGRGRVLAAVGLSWNSAGFALVLENKSRCVFTSSAELKGPMDAAIITTSDWRSLTSQHRPASGRSDQFSIAKAVGREIALLELRPSDPRDGATLTECRTAQGAASTSPFEGEWVISTEGGPRPMEAKFEVNGTTLTGTVKLGGGDIVPISSGKVEGNKISFSFVGQTKRKLYFSGSLEGDVIQLELAWAPGEYGSPFSAKRK